MAKKRQRKKIYKPPAPKLETSFNCPECGRKKVVEVLFNKRENTGYLRCRGCGVEYNGKLKRASLPIDIYYDWIDHRDEEKEKKYLQKKNHNREEVEENEGEEEEEQENEEQSQEKEDDEEEGSDY